MTYNIKAKPVEGLRWLNTIKKYEKYIPVMQEAERVSLVEGTFSPSQKRVEELNRLLSERDEKASHNLVEKALARQRKHGKK